jgi:hypothetical protein
LSLNRKETGNRALFSVFCEERKEEKENLKTINQI